MKVEEVIIIGAGPAGLAAAIQLIRYGLVPLVFERSHIGGLLHNANLVENYPGFPHGISGLELVELFVQQVQSLGIEVTQAEVLNVSFEQGLFHAETKANSYYSKVMVIATGTEPVRFTNLVIPEELDNNVFYEVYDLLGVEDQCVAIIGSGDAAFDYALNLGRKNQVIILNRARQSKCLPLLWERCSRMPSIRYRDNTIVCQLRKDAGQGLWLDCKSGTGEIQFHADYLLVAIGREARVSCLSSSLRQQEQALQERGVLYLIGDVKNGIYRQTSIAVGDGVMAAMKIHRMLKENIS